MFNRILGESNKEPSAFHQWLVLVAASLMFFYSFVQMNMLNPIGSTLMHSFSISAVQLGGLSAMYFYGNFLLIFPAGLLLDRFSPRKILFLSLLIASISMFTFAYSTSLLTADLSRFISGLCGSFAFLGAIRIVSRWFPPKKLALASGMVITLAMLGGMVAQTPIAALSEFVGWRHTLMLFGLLGLVLTFITLFVVRDYPPHYHLSKKDAGAKDISSLGFWHSIRMVISNRFNWLAGLYTTLMNLPIFVLGGLWATMYLTQAHHLTTIQASEVAAELFFGTLIGSPLIGWVSDKLKRRILPMIVGAMSSLLIVFVIIYVPNLSFVSLLVLFFVLGLVTSTQVLSYPAVAELNSPLVTGSAISVVSMLIMASGFIAQPLFGWLLDLHWNNLIVHHVAIYSLLDFREAMWIIPIGFIASFVIAFFIKETRCQMQFKD